MKKKHFLWILLIFIFVIPNLGCDYKTQMLYSSHFGINYIYQGMQRENKNLKTTEEEFIAKQNNKLKDLGIGWIRSAGHGDLTSLHWDTIEKEEGKFDFRLHDARVRDAQSKGLRVLGTVDFSDVPPFAQVNGLYFNDAMYINYLQKIVERYDGDQIEDMEGLKIPIHFWEIGNETLLPQMFTGTPADYAHVLKISYESIKANNPDCFVLIGGWVTGANSPEQFKKSLTAFETVLQNGGGDYFDIMNFHNYADNCDFMTYEHVEGFRLLLKKYGYDKPFWITESNTKIHKERKDGKVLEHSLKQQSQDLIKRMVVAFDAGIDVFFWHGLDDTENSPGVGFFNETGKPKPIYYNLKMLIQIVSWSTKLERISSEKLDYIYRFNLPNQSVFIAWTENDSPININLSHLIESENIKIMYAITEMDQKEPKAAEVPTNQIPLSKTPIFIYTSKLNF